MEKVALLGHPVSHSVSPAMHREAFRKLKLNWEYLPCDVPPGRLQDAVIGLKGFGFRGANVTVPHKERVVDFMDKLDSSSLSTGAVNTIVLEKEKLVGYNTDGEGFLLSLQKEGGFFPQKKTILILGAGGAARAIAVALASKGARHLYIANRTLEKAVRLACLIRELYKEVAVEGISMEIGCMNNLKEVDLVVQTTSLGMYPLTESSPPVAPGLFASRPVVYDIVYNPQKTRFLQEAAKLGCRTISGLGMLVYQGAASFALWTGRSAPVKEMYHAALCALKNMSVQKGNNEIEERKGKC